VRSIAAASPFAALTLAAALAGCASGDDSTDNSGELRAPNAASPADAEKAKAIESALAAYSGYLEDAREAESIPDPYHPDLKKHLADPLLTRVRLAISVVKENGALRTGTLISDPRVTTVSLDTVPATVTIQDCLDASGYKMVYADNRKKEVPGHAGGRYVATATATRYPDGRWLISTGAAHKDQPC
jgi:hypothetical protein